MYYIYALIDPRDNLAHYVGLTGMTPTRRLADHLTDRGGAKAEWLTGLLDAAFMPSFVVLQKADDVEQAQMREAWWISTGEMLGWPLTNVAKTMKQKRSTLEKAQPQVRQEVVKEIRATNANRITDLQAAVWQWRDAHPQGTQADMRRDFDASGITIARGYAHECWHKWAAQRVEDFTAGRLNEMQTAALWTAGLLGAASGPLPGAERVDWNGGA